MLTYTHEETHMPTNMYACMHACLTHTHTRRDERKHTSVPTYTAAPAACAGGFCASAIRRRYTPLHHAAWKGHAAAAAALLAHGADVHAMDRGGCGGRLGRSDAHARTRTGDGARGACVGTRTQARTRTSDRDGDGAPGSARRHASPVATSASIS